MADPGHLDHGDFVRLQIQLRRLRRNALRDLLQLVPRAADHSSGAGAGRRAVSLAQTALVGVRGALELKVGQILDRHVANLGRGGATGRRSAQLLLPEPIREPAEVAVAAERVRGEISARKRVVINRNSTTISIQPYN